MPRLSKASLLVAKAAQTLVHMLDNTEHFGAKAASVLTDHVSLPELRAALEAVNEVVNPDSAETDTTTEMMRPPSDRTLVPTARTVRASEILQVTQGAGTPTLLGKVLAEYGRIAKIEHLLDFFDADEGYRWQVHL